MYNAFAIILSILIPFFIIKKEFEKEKNIKEFIKKNKYIVLIYLIFAVGFAIRLVAITSFPNGLNVDEASIGYESYSILNFGIDRNGNFLPVFLEAWGSGQNSLYAYIVIPFVKLLGLTVLAVRLPMAIIGCISIFVFYKILRKTENKKLIFIGTAFFVIAPWHIMKSRWGLESNIFPDLVLYAVYFIINYLDSSKIKNIYISAVILGLCSYAYGTSYFFLPIFTVVLLITLLIKRKIKLKHAIGMLATIALVSFPMILFVIINTFNLKPIKLFFTIPILEENRYEELSSLFGKDFIVKSFSNFLGAIKILIIQDDKLRWNSLPYYGLTYIISLPFLIIGIIRMIREKNNLNLVFSIWLIAATLLLFVVEPNINRINILLIPVIYSTFMGILDVVNLKNIEIIKISISIIYVIFFICFVFSYFNTNWNLMGTFNGNLQNVMEYVEKNDVDKVYFEYSFKEPYIYVCFYNKIDTREFVNTVKYKNNMKGFDRVQSFGKYYFYIPDEINENEDAIYIIKKSNIRKYNFNEDYKVETIDDFVIYSK